MSTYWNLYCRTCDDEEEIWANHAEGRLAELIALKHSFAAVYEQIGSIDIPLNDNFHIYGERGSTVPLEWFHKHHDHEIVPRNEYGQCADTCSRWTDCPTCGRSNVCVLPVNHAPPCKVGKP